MMMSAEQMDVLDLLAISLDTETEIQPTQMDEAGPSNASITGGNPPAKPSKRKPSTAKTVTWEKFTTLQTQLSSMAEAVEQIQLVLLEPRPKRQKTDVSDDSDSTLNVQTAVDDLMEDN